MEFERNRQVQAQRASVPKTFKETLVLTPKLRLNTSNAYKTFGVWDLSYMPV